MIKNAAELVCNFVSDTALHKIIDDTDSLIRGYLPFSAIFILVVSLLVCTCGRKLLPLVRVILFFAVGYGVSSVLITPLHAELPEVIMHVTLAAIAAVLSRPLCFIAYVGTAGGAAFLWVYSGMLISAVARNIPVAIFVAIIAIILALYFRAYTEMLATSMLGALGAACAAELLLPDGMLASPIRIFTVLFLAVIGFIRQTRVKK